ncbi:MAG: HAMP domain-containing protein [Chlamydiae bacterium]|nr:HAMP domain-containing protein [Chlamydiota bacterium]
MSIKTRIFLWVAALFVITGCAFFMITRFELKKDLIVVRKNLQNRVANVDQQRQNQIEQYLKISLGEAKAEILTLLQEIVNHDWILKQFAPTEENYQTDTWLSSAVLMTSAERIDFVQCINDEKMTSLISLTAPYVEKMIKITTKAGVNLAVMPLADGNVRAYVAIPYWIVQSDRSLLRMPGFKIPWPENNDFWLLFSIQAVLEEDFSSLLAKPINLKPEDIGAESVIADPEFFKKIIKDVLQEIVKTQSLLKNDQEFMNAFSSIHFKNWLKKQIKGVDFTNTPPFADYQVLQEDQKIETEFIQQLLSHTEAKYMIWALSTLVGSGIWDFNPLDPMAPKAVMRAEHQNEVKTQVGTALVADKVFLKTPYKLNRQCTPVISDQPSFCIQPIFDVIQSDSVASHVFLANTLNIVVPDQKGPKSGSLTIGINGDNVLRKAALILQESVYLIQGQDVLKAYGREGQLIPSDLWQTLDLSLLAGKSEGVASDTKGNQYFFTHLGSNEPYYFVFRLRQDELFSSEEIFYKAKLFLKRVSIKIAAVLAIFLLLIMAILDRVLKKLTRPITLLSSATEHICQGSLSKVYLPSEHKLEQGEVGVLYRSFSQMVDSMIEGEKAKGLLSKVVSAKIAHKIMTSGVHLGGERKEVTVLFSDIRGFTSLSEKMQPEELVDLLNSYLSRMSDFIELYDGVVDKYVGDEIMALFGAPVDIENPAEKAILCAIDMIEDLKKWNEERKAKGLIVLEVGTGINTGVVVAGSIGGGGRANYTVIGRAVNIAERLCSAAKGMEIIVCKASFDKILLKEGFLYEERDPLELKGISEPVSNYRIFGRSKPSKSKPLN